MPPAALPRLRPGSRSPAPLARRRSSCSLVLIAVALTLLGSFREGPAGAEPAGPVRRSRDADGRAPAAGDALETAVHATWTRLPLREWTWRAAELAGRPVILDRRLDPERPITLSARGESLRDLLRQVAAEAGGAVEELTASVRIVPTAAAGLAGLAERDRAIRLATLPAAARSKALRRQAWRWPAAARPRDLVAEAAAAAGLAIAGLETIPHDHFPAAELPPLPLADRLDLVLAHFDRRILWRPGPADTVGRVVGIDEAISPAARRSPPSPPRPAPGRAAARPVDSYTLRLEAPLDRALAAVAAQLGLALEIDTDSLTARGVAAAEIVRAEVRDATRDELLDAIVGPVGLAWTIEAGRLLVFAAGGTAEGIAAAVAARDGKPSVHADAEQIAADLAEAGVPPETIAELFSAVRTAVLPGMAGSLDAFLFFAREPRWLALRDRFAEFLTLPGLTRLEADDVAALGDYAGVVRLPDVVDLTPATAAALAGFGGSDWSAAIELPGVRQLTPEAAAELARCPALLALPGLDGLPVESARGLAAHQGIGILLGGIERLPADVAAALAKNRSIQGLAFPDLTILDSMPLARRLAGQDHVFLPRLTMIEPAIMSALRGNDGGELALPGLEDLSVDTAREMVAAGYFWLTLPADRITPEVAEVLAAHNGQLTFTGDAALRPATAAAVAAHRGSIRLPQLRTIPLETARALAPHRGPLIIDGLSRLTPEVARGLAEHAGTLVLAMPGSPGLTPEVAAALAKHAGGLVLPGVSRLSTAAAVELARTPGSLGLPGLRRVTAGGLERLRNRAAGTIEMPADSSLEIVPDRRGLRDDAILPGP